MKKAILTALLCTCVAVPAYANKEKDHMDKDRMASRLIEKMDRNGDRVVSMNEHEAFSAEMFANIDTNRDRNLTHEEIASYKMKDYDRWQGADKNKDRFGYNE